MISIKTFILSITLFLVTTFYTFFGIYHNRQEDKTIDMLIENVGSLMAENTYAISNGLTSIDDIGSFRSRFNRTVNYSEIIEAIIIAQGANVLLVTDPAISSIPPSNRLVNNVSIEDLDINDGPIAYSTETIFYEDEIPMTLTVYSIINKDFIHETLFKEHIILFTFIGLPPILLILGFWGLTFYQVHKPLQALREFAYSNRKLPKPFKLRELEAVRTSLLDTFNRLENERNELFRLSTTDDLCGLANRNALTERINWLISDVDRTKSDFALLFIDLDHFKDVNDSLGHNVGDELLKQIANALRKILRQSDIIARISGDEFVVILNHNNNEGIDLLHALTRIIDRVGLPWIIDDIQVNITCSIGVVVYPKDGSDVTTLMKNADIAMYEAKKRGRNNFYFFTEELNNRVQEEIAIEREMKQSLFRDEFELYYQPKIDVHTNEIIGCEALIRWIHPGKGMIPPDKFIPIAERNGFIMDLGKWIIQEAIAQQKKWEDAGFGKLKVSINISTSQLASKTFVSGVVNAIKKNNTDPTCIDLEITEHSLMESNSYHANVSIIKYLRDLGVSFSLDDFGTGYSSLAYLKTLPLDTLKIDKSFMDDYDDPSGAIIIESVVNLAKALKYNVVAEGIETLEQLEFLRHLDCDSYQGYYAAKPLQVDQFECFMNYQNEVKDSNYKIFTTTECELCEQKKDDMIFFERINN